mgnify:CR=1 FL=1
MNLKDLRDHMAVEAMNGFISSADNYAALGKIAKSRNIATSALIAEIAYDQADEMLKAREG